MDESSIKLLQRKDPSFQDQHYDFEFLRREGLKYIGDLSGNIWTDHNVHDPGITILEMLCYALLDLGYRTKLPIQEILASPDGTDVNSHFTPAQILGNNPTTILDYRKLLIEIEGVRNAWLRPYLDESYYVEYEVDRNNRADKYGIICTDPSTGSNLLNEKFTLNGLYSILIQTEPNLSPTDRNILEVEILDRIHGYRNLCEDFVEVNFLCEEPISFCADIEIDPKQNPEAVYVQIILALEEFLSPNVRFYTLQEMLEEKAKSIEEIFEGRPFSPDYSSPGFIDTAELERMELRKEIHLSDLYSLVNSIEGVRSVRNLTISGRVNDNPHSGTLENGHTCENWIFHLAQNHVPVFSPESSCINLISDGSVFSLDPFEVQRLTSQNLRVRSSGRARGDQSYLDLPIQNGKYREDLGDYYSIQNEFPRVYGIGEGGLSDSASKLRKAQAWQLKGYLLFFDQLLVNFLSQLSDARNLFSLSSSFEENTQESINNLSSIPDLQRILQFYNEGELGQVELVPLKKQTFRTLIREELESINPREYDFGEDRFSNNTPLRRDVEIEQLVREFRQENYVIDTYPTENCFYFTIQPSSLPITLLARATFQTKEEAKIAANNISHVGTKIDNYRPINLPSNQEYSFELNFTPDTNISLTEELTETTQSRLDRRNLVLDHLLARFSEDFTEYSLLVFEQMTNQEAASQSLIKAKTGFLRNYPDISAKRGKAFNYRDPDNIWNSDNISGLEHRIAALTGIENPGRRYLCNFEVHKNGQEFQVEFTYQGKIFFRTKNTYDSIQRATDVCNLILQEAQENSFYSIEDQVGCFLIHFNSSINILPLKFEERDERNRCLRAIRNLFHHEPAEDFANIYPFKSVHVLELYNVEKELVATSSNSYPSEEEALGQQKTFIRKIKEQKSENENIDLTSLRLAAKKIKGKDLLLDFAPINKRVKVADSEYRWQLKGIDGSPILASSMFKGNQVLAFDDYLDTIFNAETSWNVTGNGLQLISSQGIVLASQEIKSRAEADLIIEEAQPFIDPLLIEKKYIKTTGTSFGFEVRNPANRLLVESVGLFRHTNQVENVLEELDVERHKIIQNEKGYSLIHFEDSKGRLIATSREATSTPDMLLDQIRSNKEQLKTVEIKKSYSFLIKNEAETETYLESFVRFRSKEKAFAALFRFLDDFKSKRLSFKEFGEPDLEGIELYVINKQGQYQAFSPKENFRKSALAKKEQKIISKFLKAFEYPISYLSESKYYLVNEGGMEVLRSVKHYSSPNTARNAGKQALCLLAIEDNIEDSIRPSQARDAWIFTLLGEDELPTATSIMGNNQEILKHVEALQEDILIHQYKTEVKSMPSRWKHRFYWINGEGKGEILYESKKNYAKHEDARKMYLEFLQNSQNISFEETGQVPNLGFQIITGNEVLIHPIKFKTEEERGNTFQDISDIITFFHEPSCEPSDIYPTERSRNQESFVYRLFKKGDPIAIHPCFCFDGDPADGISVDYRETLEKLCEKQYQYPEFCLSGGRIVIRENGNYHYVLRDNDSGDVYFQSLVSYPSKAEAIAAFQREYLLLIHYASHQSYYQKATLDDGTSVYFLGTSLEMAVAIISEDYFNNSETWAQFFLTFPIRLQVGRLGEKCFDDEIDCYYFHLLDDTSTCDQDWISTCCYDTAEEAWIEYRHFRYLLENKINYRPSLKAYTKDWRKDRIIDEIPPEQDSLCCYYLSINEVLAESCVEYVDETCAWGKEDVQAIMESHAFLTLNEAENFIKDELFGISVPIVPSPPNPITGSRITASGIKCYFIKIPLLDFQISNIRRVAEFVGEQCFDTALEAEAQAARLFPFRTGQESVETILGPRLRIILDDDCFYRIAVVTPKPESVKIPLEQLPKTEDSFIHKFNTSKGLERFLEATCVEESCVPIVKGTGKNCRYSFQIVDPDTYYFALHPLQYHTKDERDQMIDWIYDNFQSNTWKLEATGTEEAGYRFEIKLPVDTQASIDDFVCNVNGKGKFNLNWRSLPSGVGSEFLFFTLPHRFTISQADLPAYENYFRKNFEILIQDRSYLFPTGDLDDRPFGIALINPNAILATHPQEYALISELQAAIERSKACIHTEGLHLLEHILLRPELESVDENGEEKYDCSCTLLACPNFDCHLPIPAEDIDPCESKAPEDGSEEDQKEAPYYIPGLDPYSFLASAVLPYWSKRYKDPNFRTFITNTLFRETPAHIALNLLWLDPQQLCQLEDKLRIWLRHKAQVETCGADMPCDLIECLLELKNYCPKPSDQTDKDCECGEIPSNIDYRAIAFNGLVGNSRNYQSPLLDVSLGNLPIAGNRIQLSEALVRKNLSEANEDITPVSPIIQEELDLPSPVLEEPKAPKPTPKKKPKPKAKAISSKIEGKSFLAQIEAVENPLIKRSKTYALTLKLAKEMSKGAFKAKYVKELEDEVVPKLLNYVRSSKGTDKAEVIRGILFKSIALAWDQEIKKNPQKIQHKEAWKRIVMKLKGREIELGELKRTWNQKPSKKIPAIAEYLKLLDA